MTAIRIVLAASFAALAACAAPTGEEENASKESEALYRATSVDRDECEAQRIGCYQTCSTSDCYHYCDLVYEKCRGLPPSSVYTVSATMVSP